MASYYEESKNGIDRVVKIEVDYQIGERYLEIEKDGGITAIIENGDEYLSYFAISASSDRHFVFNTITKESFEFDFEISSVEHEFERATGNTMFELRRIKGKSDIEIKEFYNYFYLGVQKGTEYNNSIHMDFKSVDNGFDFKKTFILNNSRQDVEFMEHTLLNEFGLPSYYYYNNKRYDQFETKSTVYNQAITKISMEDYNND